MNAVSLFSGVGGLDLAVAEVFGAHPVAFCEFEANPSKVLAARWPEVPNLGDVRAAAWEDWTGVAVLHGGPPCQPTSSAGKRKGESDDRWMWPAALDAMRRVRPRWVVWENPSALLGLDDGEPFGRILCEMAAMGYVGSFGCLRASDVGACHGRDRLFIVAADTEHDGLNGSPFGRSVGEGEASGRVLEFEGRSTTPSPHADDGRRSQHHTPERRVSQPDSDRGDDVAPDADHGAHDGKRTCPQPRSRGGTTPHADSTGSQGAQPAGRRGVPAGSGGVDWGDYAPALARHAALSGRPAPAPVDDRGRLSARFVEWMQCFPEGWVTDVLPRNPALKALGNAVVPPQAAAALRLLLARVGTRVAA